MAHSVKRRRTSQDGSQAATGWGDEGDPREAEKIYARRRCNLKESAC
jgi:hypothetical protein